MHIVENVSLCHEKQNPNVKNERENEKKTSAEKSEREPFFIIYSTEFRKYVDFKFSCIKKNLTNSKKNSDTVFGSQGVIYVRITVQACLHCSCITAALRLHWGCILELRIAFQCSKILKY
jgi:hypothetical protein